jgi:hypothetical protein
MVKRTPLLGVVVGEVKILRRPKGEEVPIPKEPLPVKVEVPVVPKAANPEESAPEVKRLVPVALVKKRLVEVRAVEEAYGKMEFCVVEVAITKPTVGEEEALMVRVAPRATELPPLRSPV